MIRLYISGPITGTDDYKERFAAIEAHFAGFGYEVINPVKMLDSMPPSAPYEAYMRASLALVDAADVIYMMRGWYDSKGATCEHAYAVAFGKSVWYEKDDMMHPLVQTVRRTEEKKNGRGKNV